MEIIDSTGASVVKYTYNAWGEAMVSGTNISLGVINPYRYRGYYYDSGIGLYFLQTRYYDPQVGRFLSMDDVEYIDPETIGGVNLYAYCNNNPVMGVDPSGHFVITALLIGLGVGAAVGFGGTMVADYVDDGEIFNGSIGVGDYLLNSLVGGLTGALVGGLIAAAPAIGGFLGSAFSAGSAVTAGGGAVAVASTAAQALGLAGLVAGIISFARIGKSGGYKIDHHYPNDHDPTHVHISGDDGKTRVDLNGNPIQGDRPMTPGERKAFKKLLQKIIEALNP